jgi:hypothetical protein
MAWERGYYYRVRKVNGRVVREYVGGGPVGQLAAACDAEERARRRRWTAEAAAERERAEALDRLVRELDALADTLVRATMLAAGFRRHHRGDWRRRRVRPTEGG